MSTDKFGRYQATPVKALPRSSPLPLTAEGDIDAGGKRVRYVADPVDAQDCVSKNYLDTFGKDVQGKIKRIRVDFNQKLEKTRSEVMQEVAAVCEKMIEVRTDNKFDLIEKKFEMYNAYISKLQNALETLKNNS